MVNGKTRKNGSAQRLSKMFWTREKWKLVMLNDSLMARNGCPEWQECEWWIAKQGKEVLHKACPRCPECLSRRITVELKVSPTPRNGCPKRIKEFLCALLTIGLVPRLRDAFVVKYCPRCPECLLRRITVELKVSPTPRNGCPEWQECEWWIAKQGKKVLHKACPRCPEWSRRCGNP